MKMKQIVTKMHENHAEILSLLNALQPGVLTTGTHSVAVDGAGVDLGVVSNVSRRAMLVLSSAMS